MCISTYFGFHMMKMSLPVHTASSVRRCRSGCWEWRRHHTRTARAAGPGTDSSV